LSGSTSFAINVNREGRFMKHYRAGSRIARADMVKIIAGRVRRPGEKDYGARNRVSYKLTYVVILEG
jgi:hypothetical protein